MTQQKTMVSRIKEWMGVDATVEASPVNSSHEKLTSAENIAKKMQSHPNKDKQDQLQRLTTEQSELIGELTEKLAETEIKLMGCSLQSQHLAAQGIVKTHMASGGAMAFIPIPVFDFASLAGTQLSLVRRLAQHYEVDFDETTAKAVLVSLFSGVIPLVTVVGLSSMVKIIPGIGSVGGGIGMSVLSGGLVYAVGQVFIKHFEQGGTLQDFDGKQWIESFKQSFERHKALKQRGQS